MKEKCSGIFFDGMNDIIEVLRNAYPEVEWNLCKFKRYPRNFWMKKENRVLFLSHMAKQLNIRHPKDWCTVRYKDFYENGGSALLFKYSNLQNILKEHYPDFPWESWMKEGKEVLSRPKTNRDWANIDNQRLFMDQLGEKLGIRHLDEWTQVSRKTICDYGGSGLFYHHKGLFTALQVIYPTHSWNVLDMKTLPRNFWSNQANHRMILDSVVKKLKLSSPIELAKFSKQDLIDNGIKKSLFTHYSGMYEALKANYPEIEWNVFQFKIVPRNCWKDKAVQRQFLDKFAKDNNILSQEDWKHVNSRKFHLAGGSSILQQYSSFFDMLVALYPEQSWCVLNDRNVVPRGFWDDRENILQFLSVLKDKYKLKQDADWARISSIQILDSGGGGLLHKYKTLENILQKAYPETDWKQYNFRNKRKRSAQRFVFIQMQKLFPTVEVVEDYIHEEMSRNSGVSVEFDIYIPSLSVACEYQGEHHYMELPSFGSIELYQKRDKEKEELC
eukprot:CAMPEP_0206204752 /NCGR_PEP_ID=MMETSP0166-20121206/13747_1 /ASSEMBLY_ACC=CAM_ASM_000260 /TAXON_ID=95228 /ORGANISM="Vannella robusta, Strain DIVA3 518/3/11/1/6" /LENGTH=499 /DNA_ID=CAMNT_0053624511 /DNA_START=210 /DNA_END=1706 /DNA_ORIENTATION=-